MIPTLNAEILNLGQDSQRIGAKDASRQTASINHILRAFCGPANERRELQMLADEVGMGKTFVALGVAYALLSALRDNTESFDSPEFNNCYRCVLVITPAGSATLADKWERDGEAFLTRCSRDQKKSEWFRTKLIESTDQLLQAVTKADDLRRRNAPVVLVAQSSVFTKRLSDPAVRFITACLFRWWANGLQKRERFHIVKGLSATTGSSAWEGAAEWAGRGEYDINLWDFAGHERFLSAPEREREQWEPAWERRIFSSISASYADVAQALERFARDGGAEELEELRQACVGAPQRCPSDRRTRDYADWLRSFRTLKDGLRDIFKQLWPYLLQSDFRL